MGVSGISFYQQDQNYWSQAQAQSSASSADDSLIGVIGTAMTDEAKGKASIANGIALKRVNSELTAAVQAALQSESGSSSSSSSGSSGSSTSSSASSSSSSSSTGSPAVGVGTVPVTTSTPLSSLGILPGGKITVTTGTNTTTYQSTGSDTVADLIDAINVDLPTNAQVTASLNSKGQLVLTARNDTNLITVGGSGNDAAAIGFGLGNDTFSPTLPSATTSSSSSSSNSPASSSSSESKSSTASGATKSSTGASSTSASTKSSKKTGTSVSSPIQENIGSAAGILSADGVSGSLVDMLA